MSRALLPLILHLLVPLSADWRFNFRLLGANRDHQQKQCASAATRILMKDYDLNGQLREGSKNLITEFVLKRGVGGSLK